MSVANKLRQITFLTLAPPVAPATLAQQANAVPPNSALDAAAASAHPMASCNQWLATNMTPWLSMFNPYH